jgi:hypothetical protein
MSLRCAHLAPDQRREAIAKLNEKPLSALTMRLQRDHDPTAHFYPVTEAEFYVDGPQMHRNPKNLPSEVEPDGYKDVPCHCCI